MIFGMVKNLDKSFFRFVTIHADGQTDSFLVASLRSYSMQRGKNGVRWDMS